MENTPKTLKDAIVIIDELKVKLKKFTESPFVNTYITIKNQIDSFNEQLTISDEQVTRTYTITKNGVLEDHSSTIEKGVIDLFADKDSKEFDRAWKYLNECVDLNKKLDELRTLMTPDQIKEVDSKKIVKAEGVEEFLKEQKDNAKT